MACGCLHSWRFRYCCRGPTCGLRFSLFRSRIPVV
jgi:hypothetical protein